MNVLVLDLETTVQRTGDIKDNAPFNPLNKIVSAHYRFVEGGLIGPPTDLVFHHNEKDVPDDPQPLRDALKRADILVAHNAIFDIKWLCEAGFEIPETVFCTMIGEYILSRGQRLPLSLKEIAERRDVTRKKSDLVDDLFKKDKLGFEEMPLDVVMEYAQADVLSTAEIYLDQIKDYSQPENKGLIPVRDLMNEMLLFLVEIERNGIYIDLDVLEQIEADYLAEQATLEKTLHEIARNVLGDIPFNLNSGACLSKIIYGRELTDKTLHTSIFRCGTDARGKPLRPPRMSANEFAKAVKQTTRQLEKKQAFHCKTCEGTGKIRKIKKDGTPFKVPSQCEECQGRGYLLIGTGQRAGLKLTPMDPSYACIHGFKSDKITIKMLQAQAEDKGNLEALAFLKASMRLNAVNTYLSSFVNGIKQWRRDDGLLHSNFNQCVTATGRLSSTQPNFQNMPKGNKFPVRQCVVSRFTDGLIVEADFSGLEFRVAGEISRDTQIIDDIVNGKDVHKQTAMIINQCSLGEVSKDMRQNAKAYTFSPLYGGQGATEPTHVQAYFKAFFDIYQGLAKQQKKWMDGVLKNGIVRTPSGREFKFLNVKRLPNGRVTNATAIVNYPVQSFATADIVPLACVRALKAFRKHKLQSKIVLSVHDSIVVDCHPEELDIVKTLLKNAMMGVSDEIKSRFNYDMAVPLAIEIAAGKNWMDQHELDID